MIVVLDTCAIIWNAEGGKSLSKAATTAIEEAFAGDGLYISAISLWEIAWLIQRRRLKITTSYRKFIDDILISYSYNVVTITPQIADVAASLPTDVNSDPADRIIAASAITLQAPLVTADKNLRKSKVVTTIW